jgi:hypothetical protein
MQVVVATAEPRGAYHLAPLAAALDASAASFVHLVPYPEPTQGPQVVEVSHDAGLLAGCDRVVVTGGTLSAWTDLVARRANALGKPVVFSELAYLADPDPLPDPPAVVAATALSPDGARALGRYLGDAAPADVAVTGTPALDDLPAYQPVAGRVLLLSTSDMAHRDPGGVLVQVGRVLDEMGFEVRVRLHPREDPAPWAGFTVVAGETQAVSAASAQVVVGYPGSAHVLAAAVGAPTISVAPTAQLRGVLSAAQLAALSGQAATVGETLTLVGAARRPDPARVAEVVGPLGGAADRLVAVWAGPLPS